jgi:hypothetical protein
MRILLCGYEAAHAEALKAEAGILISTGHEPLVIACSKELEWELERQGVTFVSCERYRTAASVSVVVDAEAAVDTIIRNGSFGSLAYRGIPLAGITGFLFQVIAQKYLYYRELFDCMLDREVCEEIRICAPSFSSMVEENPFSHHDAEAPVHAVYAAAAARGISAGVFHGKKSSGPEQPENPLRDLLVTIALGIHNACMRLLRTSKSLSILVSDEWRNVGPLFAQLPGSTVIQYERREFPRVPFKTIVQHRMQFAHPSRRLTKAARMRIAAACVELPTRYPGDASGNGVEGLLHTVALDMLRFTLRRTLEEIERTYSFLEEYAPALVLLRASQGAQSHFSLLALVSRALGIPAIELQHGLEFFARGSLSRNHAAEYFACYGERIRSEMVAHTPAPQVTTIGSMRIDSQLGLVTPKVQSGDSLEILCIAPDIFFTAWYSDYDADRYFRAVADGVQNSKNVHVQIKLRPSSRWQNFYRESIARAFTGIAHTVAQDEPLLALCAHADIGVSCYSTAVLEFLLSGLPTILPALHPVESHAASFHFKSYADQGALRLVHTPEELNATLAGLLSNNGERKDLREGATKYMTREYDFDGRSAERLARLVRAVTGR